MFYGYQPTCPGSQGRSALTGCVGLGEVEGSWTVGGAGREAEAHGSLTRLDLQKHRQVRAAMLTAFCKIFSRGHRLRRSYVHYAHKKGDYVKVIVHQVDSILLKRANPIGKGYTRHQKDEGGMAINKA